MMWYHAHLPRKNWATPIAKMRAAAENTSR